MQMTSTNGQPLMETSGNYHLEYQHLYVIYYFFVNQMLIYKKSSNDT